MYVSQYCQSDDGKQHTGKKVCDFYKNSPTCFDIDFMYVLALVVIEHLK